MSASKVFPDSADGSFSPDFVKKARIPANGCSGVLLNAAIGAVCIFCSACTIAWVVFLLFGWYKDRPQVESVVGAFGLVANLSLLVVMFTRRFRPFLWVFVAHKLAFVAMILYEDFQCTADATHLSCSISRTDIIDITVWVSISIVTIAVAIAYYIHLGKRAESVPDDPVV